jgi:uncharacterized protein YfaS (alpha-2-macroglobulin family)
VGVGEPGDELLAKVEVTNWTDKPVRIFGGTSDCACSVLGDLPLTIEAGETQNVSVIITLRGKSGAFTRKAALLVDDGGYGVIPFRLTGLVKETPHSNQARE